MSTGPFGSLDVGPLEEELDRIIGGLNNDLGLRIYRPEGNLSPSKRKLLRQTEEEHRIDAIYEAIRTLHYQKDKRLSECLGRFRTEAGDLLGDNAHGILSISAESRRALQSCLLDLLTNSKHASLTRLPKRHSNELQIASPKRARGYLDALDDLPVHSKYSRPDASFHDSFSSWGGSMGQTSAPSYWNDSFVNTSFTSSRVSAPSGVFSSTHAGSINLASEESDYPDDDDRFSERHFNSPFPMASSSIALRGRQDAAHSTANLAGESFRQEVTSFSASFASTTNQTEDGYVHSFSSSFKKPSNGVSMTVSPPSSTESISDRVEKGLKDIWPKFPCPALTHAPLAVIWEVTRAALHCKVSLDNFDLQYDAEGGWNEQQTLRAKLYNSDTFRGKNLPSSSDSIAWKIALGEFQHKVKAVTLSAELICNENVDEPLYSLRLHPLKLELSHRLIRRFGADRFLEVSIPSPSGKDDSEDYRRKIAKWLTGGPHYFLGRVWVPFFLRDVKAKKVANPKKNAVIYLERVYMFACDGDIFRNPRPLGAFPPQSEALTPNQRTKLQLGKLLCWAVNIKKNSGQPITKLFSRLALSLSRTWPTVELDKTQIRVRERDIGEDQVMNDGVGRMSRSLATKISESLGLLDCPSAFQARLGSAKGMWIIDTEDDGVEDDWIEIYPSQTKWICDFEDPYHRTFEVRHWSSELRPASLNQQFIPVLEGQAIRPDEMREVMAKHLKTALRSDLDAQIAAMKEPIDLRLWIQQAAGNLHDRSLFGYTEFLGGLPDSNADKVAFLLDSGFDQRKTRYLYELVWEICKRKTDTLKNKMNITIPCSSYIYMVADFTSTLEEGEVHLSFSTKFQVEGFSDTLLEDTDVLVARAPAHFPSDIQRVRVVSRPELRKLKDVIVFSTKGKVPLADKLSGGDYDGDRAWVCWDREIVDNFRNSPVPKQVNLVEKGYLRKVKTEFREIVRDIKPETDRSFEEKCDPKTLEEACREFMYRAFLFSLQRPLLGQCTKYKERLCYVHRSVKKDSAILLSTLLSNLVDQSKQGIEFSKEDWERFKAFLQTPKHLEDPAYTQEKPGNNWKQGKPHILDHLKFEVAEEMIDEALMSLNSFKDNGVQEYDQDLTKMYHLVREIYEPQSSDCGEIMAYLEGQIRHLCAEWKQSNARLMKSDSTIGFAANTSQLYQKWVDIAPPLGFETSEMAETLLRDWGAEPNTTPWALLKASTTFTLCYRDAHKFVWHMAGRQLGYLKARSRVAARETAPVLVIPEMWGVLRPDKKLIASLAAQREAKRVEEESAMALDEVLDFDDNGTVLDDA